ncbi:hypothetical protein [Streptomyces violaceorubidus]|uniref:Uncharacterized protein n=1 Tax=Streptomyces violaceorubidus TaxID=284042 RepID=A0ABV1SRN7_9ACTN
MLREPLEQHRHSAPDEDTSVPRSAFGAPLDTLRHYTAEPFPLRRRRRTRRRARRRLRISAVRAASLAAAALAAVIASSVSTFSGMAAYEPLRLTASASASGGVVSW